jgi:hypothetical protein
MLGHLTHPSVGMALCLEHGCEKTHNDFFHNAMAAAGVSASAFGYASIQLDGGIEAVTERVLGSFLVPSDGKWSYNFEGVKFSPLIKYELALAPPAGFFDEVHRPAHFLGFAGEDESKGAAADREDSFA